MKIKEFKIGKKIIAGFLTASIIGTSGIVGFHLYKENEIKRVKSYLNDFRTEENYVDMSKISCDYDIKGFDGKILAEALRELDVSYVRFNDSYIYDGKHVTGFEQKTATDYTKLIGIDKDGKEVYVGYEPIRAIIDGEIEYIYPDTYTLEDIHVYHEPIRYDEIDSKEVVVIANDYEESYSLVLENKHKR